MKRHMKLGLFTAVVVALVAVLALSPAASAQTGGITVPATCTDLATGAAADCTLELVGFTSQNGTVQSRPRTDQ